MSAIIGTPGGSLTDATWAASDSIAAAGREGELATARVLAGVAHVAGPTVLHDLRIPAAGVRANIDHAVIAGRRVWLIDSKYWRPGLLWTFGSTSYRGTERFELASKRTMPMAIDAVTSYLERRGIDDAAVQGLAVVWPSSPGRMSTWALRMPGAHVVPGARFETRAARTFGSERADQSILDNLTDLVHGPDN